MPGSREYDQGRLDELILYIADKGLGDARFGKTKLNKILFYSDFAAYLRLGKSITGAEYFNLPEGPAPHQMKWRLTQLEDRHDIVIRAEKVYSHSRERIIPLRPADLTVFSGEEIAIVDEFIEELRPLTAKQVSQRSHETVAWRITYEDQLVPYEAAYLSQDDPTEEDLLWLKGVAVSGAVQHS